MTRERLSPARTLGFLERLSPRLRPYRGRLFWASILILASTGVGLAFPLLVRDLLDAAFLAGSGQMLNRIALGLLGLFAFQALLNFSQSYLVASVSEWVMADLRKDLFRSLVAQTPGFFAARRVGELSSRLASDTGLIQQVLCFIQIPLVRRHRRILGRPARRASGGRR